MSYRDKKMKLQERIREQTVYSTFRGVVNMFGWASIIIGMVVCGGALLTEYAFVILLPLGILGIMGGFLFKEAGMIFADIADMMSDKLSEKEVGDGE